MKSKIRSGIFLFGFILFTVAVYIFSGNKVHAEDLISPDEFSFRVSTRYIDTGEEFEMTDASCPIYIYRKEGLPPDTKVEWKSSNERVIRVVKADEQGLSASLQRKGPGYSAVTAIVTVNGQVYTIGFTVKVDFEIDYSNSAINKLMRYSTVTNERILVMDSVNGSPVQIPLKFKNYATAITEADVSWETSNESVVTVDENGIVTPVGCGSATITVTTNTVSANYQPLKNSVMIVVTPYFTLSNGITTQTSGSSKTQNVFITVASRSFYIESGAKYATNLKWEIYDWSTDKKLSSSSDKLNYSIHENDGVVEFTNVKAGTYEIYAFANEKYTTNTNAPYAYMKVIVPVLLDDEDIVMNVGDTYDIVKNSNITNFGIFNVTYGSIFDSQIAQVSNKGIITAKSKGKMTIKLVYNGSEKLYDSIDDNDKEKTITVTVIDSIALNVTEALLYTRGTMLLDAIVTDPTVDITWSSSDTSVATVEDGLVTAVKPGVAIITAQQIVDGVVKKATCAITVKQSVSSITIDPSKLNIDIGDYKTLIATISPKIAGISLTWKTSNEKVVKIIDANSMSATIQGVSAGNAVISAINEDNIVVGYCHVTVRQPVTSIKLSDTDVTVNLQAKSIQLRATVYPEDATNKKVNWTSSNTQIARVSENGLVTLLKPGEVTIIATSEDNPEAMALCNISIEIPVTSVALDETEVTMYVGQTKRLTYTVLPINASTNSVTWTSTNNSVATVDSNGKVTAKKVGSAVIMLKSVDGGYTSYCTVNVKQVAEDVSFRESEIELVTGQTEKLEYTLVPANATDANLVWESSDTKVAVVDDNGKVTAKSPGVAFIIARTEAGGMSYVKVTVKQPVTGIILNFNEKTIYVNDKFQLKVSVKPSEASDRKVKWESSNTRVATVSEEGEVTGVAVGTAVITCTTENGGFSASCVVSVIDRLADMKLNYSEYRLSINKSVTLSVVVGDKTITNQQFKWVSSNSNVATVNSKGKVTGHKTGTAVITAYAQDGSGADASCEIEVVRPVKKVTLNKNYLSMLIGDTRQLKATVQPGNATYKDLKWVIEGDSDVVMVDEDGYVTALKEGTVNIKAMAQDDSGKFAMCQVIVNKRVPATSVIMPDKRIVMVQGEQRTIKPVLSPVNSTDSISWSTDNSAVAKVDSNGKITAKSTGTATITALTDSGKTASIEVNVIGLNVTELTLEQYSRYTLQVEGATSRVSWHVADPEIAVVNNGVVITKARGTTVITATVNGRKLTCKLTVVKIK